MLDTTIFYEKQSVMYNNIQGYVNFVCDDYITVCVRKGEHRSQDVCLIVYPYQYNQVHQLDNK